MELDIYKILKKDYKIYDLVNKYKKVIFILESPHIDELLQGVPVSGLSGKTMMKKIFPTVESTMPIGPYLKSRPENPIGIMNVCSIPMQLSAYLDDKVVAAKGELSNKYKEEHLFFDNFEKIRTAPKAKYKSNPEKEVLQNVILSDFRDKMTLLAERELVIIPCGKTAQTFFELSGCENVSSSWRVIKGVPHPAYGNWDKQKYADIIGEVKELVRSF